MSRKYKCAAFVFAGCAVLSLTLAGGCSTAAREEAQAKRNVSAVGESLGVGEMPSSRTSARVESGELSTSGQKPPARLEDDLGALRADSPEADFVRFAVYHHPAVRAAYFDWKASVEAIAPARALPDPQLTFQADIATMLMSFMPGLMFDIMGPGKRGAMAHEAMANSSVAYRAYVGEVVKVAGGVRKAWVELAYAEETDRLYQRTIRSAEQAVALAAAQYQTGQGMVNFEQQVRFQNTLAQHHSHHRSVAELLVAARAKFKAALGLLPTDPDPAWPKPELVATNIPAEDELWTRIQTANPDLAKMRAMVDMTVAGVAVARTGGTPDFTAGLMVDTKQDPLMFRPTATMTLPIWREKIRSNMVAAEARRDAASARVTAEQLNMAAQLAQMLYMIRDADSMLAYMNGTALPNLDQSVASAGAALESGMGNAAMLAETQLMKIDMQHERLDALRERENAVVDLALMINAVLPENAPLPMASEVPNGIKQR